VKSVIKPRLSLKHSGGHVTSGHTVANSRNQVSTAGKLGRLGSYAEGVWPVAVVQHTSTINNLYEETHINMQMNDITVY